MTKTKVTATTSTPMEAAPVQPLRDSAAAAALQLLQRAGQLTGEGAAPVPVVGSEQIGAAQISDWADMPALKARCMAFGIEASDAELITAGLHLLSLQTETALEVALLQSLRADRSSIKRRTRR